MKLFVIITLVLLNINSIAGEELVYIASGGDIHVKKIDPATGKLADFQTVKATRVSIFTFSHNKKFFYGQGRDFISTYEVGADGRLTFLHKADIAKGGADLKTDRTDSYLTSPGYRTGLVSVWKLEEGIYKGEVVQELKFKGGVHSTRFSKDNKFLFVPSTRSNRIWELAFDESSGKITGKGESLGPKEGAAQPRHLVFHPKMDVAYTTMERNLPGVGSWKWIPTKGTFELMQNIASNQDVKSNVTTADLHISPDQKFLFASQRGDSQILVYKINPEDGRLTFVKGFPCENTPRSFCISKSGDFIYVAGQNASSIGAYKVDRETGHLSEVEVYHVDGNPIWVETLVR